VLERITNQMSSRVSLQTLARTNSALFETQQQISTGRVLRHTSDNVAKAATVGVLDDRLLRSVQLMRNYQHAGSALGEVDSTLDAAHDIALEAKSLASSQLAVTSSAGERASQARVVDGLLQGLFTIANRQGVAGYVLGGSTPSRTPVSSLFGAYRATGSSGGLTTDLDAANSIPITLGASNPIISGEARAIGTVDLRPRLSAQTRLRDVAGALGGGLRGADGQPSTATPLGSVKFSFAGGPLERIDFAGSDTVEDVRVRVEASLRSYEQRNNVTILDPGGVTVGDDGLLIDIAGTGASPALEFFNIGTGTTAADLGLTASTPIQFTPASSVAGGLSPRLTWQTPVADLRGTTGPLGSIRLGNAGRSAEINLSNAVTLGDVKNIIAGANLGARVELNAAGDGIDIVNELSAASSASLWVGEVAGSGSGNAGDTATRLGIRTLSPQTRLESFNFGRGVSIVNNVIDPTTNEIRRSLNVDFEVIAGDSTGSPLSIDLRPQDTVTVQTLLARMNTELADGLAAAGLPAGSITAGLAADGNGITLTQSAGFSGPLTVRARNNSLAAEQLGLLGGTYDGSSLTLTSQDRSRVRNESLFTALADLRESLAGNSPTGIALAGELVESVMSDLAELRGVVGGHAQRVESASSRESDRAVLDETVRSQLRDVDYTEAATRFSLLQTQLEAGLRTTASLSQRSLLDYLG